MSVPIAHDAKPSPGKLLPQRNTAFPARTTLDHERTSERRAADRRASRQMPGVRAVVGASTGMMQNRLHDRPSRLELTRKRRTAVHVVELWRHPVKSLQGEPLDEAVVEDSGLSGDRGWGIVDRETGKVLTARRVPSLLLASARLTDTGVEILLPDGDVLIAPSVHADDALSKWIGRPVALVRAESFGGGVGEYFADATDDNSAVVSWTSTTTFCFANPVTRMYS